MANRAFSLGLAILVVCAFIAGPATAGKKKRKKSQSATVTTTLYGHGPNQLGEIDAAIWLVPPEFGKPSPLTLDAQKPSGGQPKSMGYFNPVFNPDCTGLPSAFPTFNGAMTGTIKGDMKLTGYFMQSTDAKVIVRVWFDVPTYSGCTGGVGSYVPPHAEQTVDVPQGQSELEVVFAGLDVPVAESILVEFVIPRLEGSPGRLLYDSASAATRVEFQCVPPVGAATCAP